MVLDESSAARRVFIYSVNPIHQISRASENPGQNPILRRVQAGGTALGYSPAESQSSLVINHTTGRSPCHGQDQDAPIISETRICGEKKNEATVSRSLSRHQNRPTAPRPRFAKGAETKPDTTLTRIDILLWIAAKQVELRLASEDR